MQPRFSLRVSTWVLGTAIMFLPGQASTQDLCSGLVVDTRPHPMSFLSKPALGQTVRDPEFGTTIRRITAVVPVAGRDPAIKPMYSTISAWNADESLLILYHVGVGHELYDGRTYQFIRQLDISPADLEQVYWHTSNPDILYYVEGNRLIRYRARSGVKETVRVFSFCTSASGGGDPMFTSWDSRRIGLGCGSERFIYDIDADAIVGQKTMRGGVPQVAPSGSYAFLDGTVTNASLTQLRVLDLGNPSEHASLGQLASGRDTYNGVAFDPGPRGSDIGTLVMHDMTDGSWRVIVGPATGYPYPPSGTHVSALAYKRPGWVFVSAVGNPAGQGVLDNEVLLADTNTGKVCRLAHHRSWGKNNTRLAAPYWAEPHVVPSPSGTRALFGSDWGNGSSVDSYVIELPGYGGAPPPPPEPEPTPPPPPEPEPTPPPPPEPHPTPPPDPTPTPPPSTKPPLGKPPKPKPIPPLNNPPGSKPPAQSPALSPAPAPQPKPIAPSNTVPKSPPLTPVSPVPLGDSGGRSASGEPGFGGGGEAGYSFAARPRASRTGSGGAGSSAAPVAASSTPSGTGTATAPPAGTPFSRGLAELKAGRYESAQKELQGAVAANPKDAAAHYYLGYTYHLMAQQSPTEKEWARKAAEEIALAYRLQPNFTPLGGKEPRQ